MKLDTYLKSWDLTDPQLIAETETATLYRVEQQKNSLVLKLFKPGHSSESSTQALKAFAGVGSVKLYNAKASAQLLEFINGPSLSAVVKRGEDKLVTKIATSVVEKLHSNKIQMPSKVSRLNDQVSGLAEASKKYPAHEILLSGAKLAKDLTSSSLKEIFLHGDLHHDNIRFDSRSGWLSFDPKGLWGEPTYDVANFFYNPEGEFARVKDSTRIQFMAQTFARSLKVPENRVLQWAFVHGCLSASWQLEDKKDPRPRLEIAKTIQALLGL